MKARTVIEVIASLLIVLFLFAATAQVVSHSTFQSQINRSLSHYALAGIIAGLLPAIHLTLAFLLWRPATRLAGFSCSLAMISCYTVYLIMNLPISYKSVCRCGELWQLVSLEINILINLAIILLAATAIILTGRFAKNSPRFS